MSKAGTVSDESVIWSANDSSNVKLNVIETLPEGKLQISSTSYLPQVIGSGVAALIQVGLGTVAGYSAVTIPLLTNSTSTDLFLDQEQVALFSSLLYLAAAVGCLIGTLPMVWLGQRMTMIICLPVLLAGWVMLASSTTIQMLQLSRIIIGLTIGVIESASYQYTTEIAHSAIRGQMVGALDTMRQLGIMFVYTLGITSLSWKAMAWVCGCTTVIPSFIALLFVPNSPRWLATRGRIEEAFKSLSFYRGSHYNIDSELSSIISQLNEKNETTKGLFDQILLMKKRYILKIVIILAILLFAVQFTGNIVIIAYSVPILEAVKVSMNPYICAIIVGGIRVIGTVCSLIFVDHVGRKPALFVSFLLCAVSITTLGLFFYLKSLEVKMRNMDWLPLTTLVFYTFFSCIGHPTLNLVRGELLPTSVRSAAMPFLGAIFFAGMFLASQTFPLMISTLGEYGAFWVYGGVCVFMVITIAVIIPETRKKDLEYITVSTLSK